MSKWNELAHWMYGKGFWYAHPLWEVKDLTEEQLFWVPDPNSLCILWQLGHIAHRERVHIGQFLQGLDNVIPLEFEVFGPDWCSVDDIRKSIDSVESVFDWVKDVREKSHEYIDTLKEEDFHRVVKLPDDEISVAHWLFITVAHGALHIGRIQMLRVMIEGTKERAC